MNDEMRVSIEDVLNVACGIIALLLMTATFVLWVLGTPEQSSAENDLTAVYAQ